MILLLLSCGDAVEQTAPSPDAGYVPLDDAALVRRLSLDLRGVLPGEDELDALESGAVTWADLRDDYLDDPRLEERLVALLAEQWLTRVDTFEVQYYDYHLDPEQEFVFERSVGEEPLRLMAHIAVQDRPWTETVTADYTMANDLLADIWPLDHPGGGWQEATYTDLRPAAGVLSTNGLWWRYVTNISNLNRSRAAAISQLLLCSDPLSRPVSFSGSSQLAESDGTANAIREDPYCVACHASIEPLAASLFGFWSPVQYSATEFGTYHAERESLWEVYIGVEPGWFGTPIEGLVDLGGAIAADPRFVRCATQRAATMLWRRDVLTGDFDQIETLRQAFIDGDLRMRALLSAITDTPVYRAGAVSEASLEETENTRRLLTPDQWSTVLADLTGFTWTWEGYDQLANDTAGYRMLLGGVDGDSVATPQHIPGLTWAVSTGKLAEAAASHVAQADLSEGGDTLLRVTVDDRPGDDAFTAQLTALHRRLYAARPTDAELEELGALWSDMAAISDPVTAWTGLLSVMLRDPRMVSY